FAATSENGESGRMSLFHAKSDVTPLLRWPGRYSLRPSHAARSISPGVSGVQFMFCIPTSLASTPALEKKVTPAPYTRDGLRPARFEMSDLARVDDLGIFHSLQFNFQLNSTLKTCFSRL